MVPLTVVVLILEEEVLVYAVTGEGDAGNTEAGEDTLKAVEAAEGAGVSPCFISGPGISLGVDRARGGRGLELIDVETGGVGHVG